MKALVSPIGVWLWPAVLWASASAWAAQPVELDASPTATQKKSKAAAEQAAREAEAEVARMCGPVLAEEEPDWSELNKGERDFEEWFEHSVAKDRVLRQKIASYMAQNPESRCEALLRSKLSVLSAPGQGEDRSDVLAALRPHLLLAVSAKLSGAAAKLADTLARDQTGDWLLALRSLDPEAYSQTLDVTAEELAARLRKDLQLPLQEESVYGRVRNNVFVKKSVRHRNPLFVHSYVSDLMDRGRAPQKQEWAALHVFYATLGVQEKTTVVKLIADLVQRHDRSWVESFRREPSWVQFRLMTPLREVMSPEVVRELMWLSEQHVDERMKAVASTTLDAIVERSGK